jgi:hypothetical protein
MRTIGFHYENMNSIHADLLLLIIDNKFKSNCITCDTLKGIWSYDSIFKHVLEISSMTLIQNIQPIFITKRFNMKRCSNLENAHDS